jgi:hypothetical protein
MVLMLFGAVMAFSMKPDQPFAMQEDWLPQASVAPKGRKS